MKTHRLSYIALASAMLWVASSSGVHAQPVYRIVGPDGKVSFSDKPPAASEKAKVEVTGVAGASSAASNTDLPYELRQVAGKYPVTLYTGPNCAPCDTGRGTLSNRGIPFTERTVSSAADLEQLKKLSGESSLPFLTIGSQRLKGYSDSEWNQYLDAAGYPKSSQLPKSYKRPAASPLVGEKKPAPPSKATEPPNTAEPAPAPTAPPVNPNNPAGIVF
jgi:glutaredoxin